MHIHDQVLCELFEQWGYPARVGSNLTLDRAVQLADSIPNLYHFRERQRKSETKAACLPISDLIIVDLITAEREQFPQILFRKEDLMYFFLPPDFPNLKEAIMGVPAMTGQRLNRVWHLDGRDGLLYLSTVTEEQTQQQIESAVRRIQDAYMFERLKKLMSIHEEAIRKLASVKLCKEAPIEKGDKCEQRSEANTVKLTMSPEESMTVSFHGMKLDIYTSGGKIIAEVSPPEKH